MKIVFSVLLFLISLKAISQIETRLDESISDVQREMLMCPPPSPTALSCGASLTLNLTSSGYTGSNPTSGDAGCNPCCYSGADLDCDGLQDVPFSVENSKWYKYCNSSGSSVTINVDVDEPGSGSSCNLQGAVWVGSSAGISSSILDCGNSGYFQFDSNPGGASDGWNASVVVPNGQCAYIMIDGYAGSTCAGINLSISGCSPLPIELLSFEGNQNGPYNVLVWVVSTQTNNDQFVVEKSQNGIEWNKAAAVDGAGTTSESITYSHSDKAQGSDTYYRLKQIDFNGDFSFSNTILVKNKQHKDAIVFPNPFDKEIIVNIYSDFPEEIQIEVFDVLGKIVFFTKFKNFNENTYRLNPNLSDGIYTIVITSEDEHVQKFSIIKETD